MIGKKINQLATELAPAATDLTIIGDPTTGVSKKITLAQLGAIFSGAVSFYSNLAGFPAVGDINVIYCAKDTQKLYLWSGSAYVEVFPSQALLDTYQLRSEKGVSNGYASLDSQGKVPISQLPSSIMEYKGTWSAATNTPTLANGTGDTGDVYICNAAGSVNFGAGAIAFAVGDYVIYSGSIWQRSSGAVGTVTSVAVSRSGDALAITGSPVTTSGTINIGFAGNSTQYINGAGNLVTFPGVINEAQNLITEVYNKTGATLTKGTVVYINGGQGNLPAVTKALATGDSTSAQTYGIVRNDITNNNNGYVVVAGRISDLDTQAYTEGTQLYLSPTTAGTFTSTKPYAPQHLVYVGIVVRAHPTQGVVEVKIQNGYELDELHNVAAQSPSNGDILQYVSSTSLWTKVAGTTSNIAEGSNLYYTDARSRAALSFTAGSGAYNSTTGVITIPTNTNQLTNGASFITLASLSAGAGISYNNTTGVIASTITQYTDANARAAISLTTSGTSGAATYNSTTGILNVPQYAPDLSGYVPTSRTLTINGTAYDLSANRSWSVGTVTSVGLSSATSGVTIGSTPITTSGTITLAIATASGSQQGLLSSTDWTTFNNKQNALTNPVTGTGTTNYLPKFTGTSTIGNSAITDDGTTVSLLSRALSGTSATFSGNVTTSGGNFRLFNGYFLTAKRADGADINAIGFEAGSNTLSIKGGTSGGAVSIKFEDTGGTIASFYNGNLGLGVTPSAWSGFTAMQVLNSSLSTTGSDVFVNANCFFNGSNWRYIASAAASQYYQDAGSSIWRIAPSGTAGNAISFTQAMTLNASGNLSIGNTNDSFKLDVTGTGRFQAPSGTQENIIVKSANTGFSKINIDAVTGASAQLAFLENGTQKGVVGYRPSTGNVFLANATSDILTIASTGAATFSSSVTVNNTGGVPSLNVRATDTNFALASILGNQTGDVNWLLMSGYPVAGDFTIRQSDTVNALTLKKTTGAATFSSSVTASTLIFKDAINSNSYGFRGLSGIVTLDAGSVYPTGWNFQYGGGASSALYINGSGNVGIGSASPAQLLTIQNTSSNPYLSIIGGASATMGVLMGTTGNTVDGQIIYSNSTQHMAFVTASAERMRITSGGSVGIGTTSPSVLLHLNTTDTVNNIFRISNGTQALNLGVNNSSGGSFIFESSVQALRFGTSDTERMRITSGGNLLVGTTSDNGAKFQVTGGATFSSGITATAAILSSITPITLTGNSNSGTFNQTTIYVNQNNTSNSNENGIFIERGRLSDSSSAEIRRFVIGARGGQIQWICDKDGSTTQYGSIKTGEPDTGWGTAAIKIGASVSGTAFNVTRYLPVSVDGTVYYINLNSSTP